MSLHQIFQILTVDNDPVLISGWLRTEEENMRMREAKLVNSKQGKSPNEPNQQVADAVEDRASPEASSNSASAQYQPRVEEIHNYLSPENVQFIDTIVSNYWKAYRSDPIISIHFIHF